MFAAVQQENVDYAVIPFENSTNGSVVQTLDLLADRDHLYKDTRVCGEYYLTVHHCLLVRKDTSSPERPSRKSITKLYTHPQVWGQCELFLSENLKGVERQDVSSTSKAAEIISTETTEGSAAIASRFAAEHHGVDVLEADIEDKLDNTTRFLILRNVQSGRTSQPFVGNSGAISTTGNKTLILFMVNHDSPGALADALLVFKTHGMNLTSINTRPSRKRPWHYIFFVECGCTPAADDRQVMEGLLGRLREIVEDCRELGTWKDQLHIPS